MADFTFLAEGLGNITPFFFRFCNDDLKMHRNRHGNARAINKLIPGRLTVLLIIKP